MKIQGKVPEDFPNEYILIDEDNENNKGKLKIPDGYRRLDENNNLRYFFSRMVTAIHPSGHRFNHDKERKRISEIVSSSDEAFALLVIYNEIDRWKYRVEKNKKEMESVCQNGKRKRASGEPPKKFNNASSGDKDGWSNEGRKLYQDLCKQVEDLRKDPITGKNPEEVIRECFIDMNATKYINLIQPLEDGGMSITKQELGGFVPPALEDIFGTTGGMVTGGLANI